MIRTRLMPMVLAALAVAGCSDAPGDADDSSTVRVGPLSCDALACAPLGACDTYTGTCACESGAWFDGRGCATVEGCPPDFPPSTICAPACPVPTAPTLRRVAASETLHFAATDHVVEVGVSEDLDAGVPASWELESDVVMAPFSGRSVRVFARILDPACPDPPVFNGVFEVSETYAGPASSSDTDAVAAESGVITAWASEVIEYVVGADVDEPFSDPTNALGPAEGNAFDIVSLGSGGTITLGFDAPIADGPGDDFAVFENGFGDEFLELAFVEVSSDGDRFFRLDGASSTAESVSQYGTVDTRGVGQLAGKYGASWGTAFDLATLRQRPEVRDGRLDLSAITAIRIVDIVGDGGTTDAFGRPIYDPYPTVESAGFDLDGVAVLGGVTR